MKKKKQPQATKQDDKLTLSSLLDSDLVNQLKNKQKELEKEQQLQKEREEKVELSPRGRSGKKGELFDGSATSELPHDINESGELGFNEPLNIYMLKFLFLRGKYDRQITILRI